jgi:hypothetical protein
MRPKITVRILPSSSSTRVLVTESNDQLLKARFPEPSRVHRLAAPTLLEAIALFYQQRVRVVLSADSEVISSALGLTDGFGFGNSNLYYEVEVVPDAHARRRGQRVQGVGDFRDVCRLQTP